MAVTIQEIELLLDRKLDEKLEEKLDEKFGSFRVEMKAEIAESECRIINRITERIDDAEVRLFNAVNDTKVNRTELQQLEKRVSTLEDIILD